MSDAQEWAAEQGFTPKSGGLEAVLANLDGYAEHITRAAARAADQIAILLENYAKANHPWKDDTGNTQSSTHGTWQQLSADLFEAVLSAGMDYDIFLELARDGKWSWLWPAVTANEEAMRQILVRELGA